MEYFELAIFKDKFQNGNKYKLIFNDYSNYCKMFIIIQN